MAVSRTCDLCRHTIDPNSNWLEADLNLKQGGPGLRFITDVCEACMDLPVKFVRQDHFQGTVVAVVLADS